MSRTRAATPSITRCRQRSRSLSAAATARLLRRRRRHVLPSRSDNVAKKRLWNFHQTDQHSRIVSIVLGEEKRVRLHLHEHIAVIDRRDLQHEHGVVIAEAGEKASVHEK